MPWLPSHVELRNHPKILKAATLLAVPKAQMIGHLHLLWWWAYDYAPDGSLAGFDATDISLGAEWEGDPDSFVEALLSCGPGQRAGLLERPDSGELRVHDWDEHAGKFMEYRRKDAARKREAREASAGRPDDASAGPPREGGRTAHVQVVQEGQEKTTRAPARGAAPRARRTAPAPAPEPDPPPAGCEQCTRGFVFNADGLTVTPCPACNHQEAAQ